MQPEARSHDLELQQKPQVSYAENMCLIKMETDAALFFFFFFFFSFKIQLVHTFRQLETQNLFYMHER